MILHHILLLFFLNIVRLWIASSLKTFIRMLEFVFFAFVLSYRFYVVKLISDQNCAVLTPYTPFICLYAIFAIIKHEYFIRAACIPADSINSLICCIIIFISLIVLIILIIHISLHSSNLSFDLNNFLYWLLL